MLLAAVPQTVTQEAISLREMTCVQLVFRILKLYQPGGLNEKSTILNNLTQTTAAKSAAEAGEMLRQWRRQLLRARELGLHVPDPLLQVSALSEVMRTVIAKEHQASFRISNFRMTHMVDDACGDAFPHVAHDRRVETRSRTCYDFKGFGQALTSQSQFCNNGSRTRSRRAITAIGDFQLFGMIVDERMDDFGVF